MFYSHRTHTTILKLLHLKDIYSSVEAMTLYSFPAAPHVQQLVYKRIHISAEPGYSPGALLCIDEVKIIFDVSSDSG